MDTLTRERYREARAQRWPYGQIDARQALRIARAADGDEAAPWTDRELYPDNRAEWERDGFTLRATVHYDTHGGFPDYLGTLYHREADIPWKDRREARRIEFSSRVYQGNHGTVWLVPMSSYGEQREYYRTNSKVGTAAAHLRSARSVTETVERAQAWLEDEWTMIGIRVRAYRAGVELGEGSVWGVESDGGLDYFNEVTRDMAQEAIEEARAALDALCAASREEATA